MTNKKRVDKWVYGFMTFLILLNSLTPLTSLAEEKESPSLKLENVSKGQSETQLELTLQTTETTDKTPVKIRSSQAIIDHAELEQNGQTTALTVENAQ
ncbi:hypothetical protein [uncultured Enterococcus sp.]|nr:hypothetical protein [uncultured Enterococcus sp.]